MLTNLMDDTRLLNLSLQTLLFRGFLRFFFLFSLLHMLRVKKHNYSKSFCRKKNSQFNRKKDMVAMNEERELFFVSLTHINY